MEELFEHICEFYPDKFIVIADTKTDKVYAFYRGTYVAGTVKDPQGKQYLLLEMFEAQKNEEELSKMILNFFFKLGSISKITVEKARTFYHFIQEAIFKFNGEKVKSIIEEKLEENAKNKEDGGCCGDPTGDPADKGDSQDPRNQEV
jgi:hypothetical protein